MFIFVERQDWLVGDKNYSNLHWTLWWFYEPWHYGWSISEAGSNFVISSSYNSHIFRRRERERLHHWCVEEIYKSIKSCRNVRLNESTNRPRHCATAEKVSASICSWPVRHPIVGAFTVLYKCFWMLRSSVDFLKGKPKRCFLKFNTKMWLKIQIS